MIHYKSHKETKKTFSITFDVDNANDVKKLKALAIITGAFNPLKKESTDVDALFEEYRKIHDGCVFENMVYEIAELLK